MFAALLAGGLALVAWLVVAPEAAAQASQLGFVAETQPRHVGAGQPFAITVGVYDSSNVLFTSGSHTVTLTLVAPESPSTCPGTYGGAAKPCGRLLSGSSAGQQGTIQGTTSSGLVTFSNLRIDAIAKGYRLQATATSLTSATSDYFDVTSGEIWSHPRKDPQYRASTTFAGDIGTAPSLVANLAIATGSVVSDPVVIDLDRDGLLDVVAVTETPNSANAIPRVQAYRQTSPGVFASYWSYSGFPAFTNIVTANAKLSAGDLNGDEVPEVVVNWHTHTTSGATSSAGSWGVTVLAGDSGSFVASWQPTRRHIKLLPPTIGDLDGTGQNRIVVPYYDVTGNSYSDLPNAIAVLSLSGSTLSVSTFVLPTVNMTTGVVGCNGFFQFMSTPPALAEVRSSHAGLEILVGTDGTSPESEFYYGSCIGPAAPIGRLYLCQFTSGVITCPEVLATPGTTTGANNDQYMRRVSGIKGMSTADLDGDGSLEVALHTGRVAGNVTAVNNLMVVRTSPSLSLSSSIPNGYIWNRPATADIDGDGNPDIASVEYDYDNAHTPKPGDVTVRGFASGSIVTKGRLVRPAPAGGSTQSAVGGALAEFQYASGATPRAEFVFATVDGNLTATTGGSVSTNPTTLWTVPLGVNPGSGVSLGDLTGDCRPEILVGLSNGNVRVYQGASASVPATVPEMNGVITGGPAWTSPGTGLQAKIYWNAPSDGGLPILSYRVYRATSITGTYSEVGVWRGATPPTQASPFTDAVSSEGDYYYKVTAVNCVGESTQQANPFWAEVKVAQTPTGLTGTVGDTGTPQYRVILSWTASVANAARPNGCGSVDNYWVFRGSSASFVPDTSGFTNRLANLAAPTTTYTDNLPATSTDYYYKVIATNCVGFGAATTAFWAEVKVAQAPGSITTTVNATLPSVTVSWTASPANAAPANGCGNVLRYRIYRSVGSQAGPFDPPAYATVSHPTTTYTDTLVGVGSHYYYKVAAINCVGEGSLAPSGNGVLADLKPPNAPSLSVTGVASNRVDVTWTMPVPADPAGDGPGVGVAKYEAFWRQGAGVTTSDAKLSPDATAVPATPIQHVGRIVNTQYCYAVRAIDANGNVGVLSIERCAVTPDTDPPSTVLDLVATSSLFSEVQLNWTSATDNLAVTGYELYWQVGPGVTTGSTRLSPDPGASAVARLHTGRTQATEYCYRIRAYDAAGNKAALGNEACVTTPILVGGPPRFELAASTVTALEDAGTVSLDLARNITSGLPAPGGVAVRFHTTVTNPALFAGGVLPSVSPAAFASTGWSGVLTFRTGPDRCGSTDVQLVLEDDAGDAGRFNVSAPQTVTIQVPCVNDAPTFATVGDIEVGPGSGAFEAKGWASSIRSAPATATDEQMPAQRVRFEVSASDLSLFEVSPSVSPTSYSTTPSGDLTFTPGRRLGSSSVQVCLVDDGATANGGVDRTCRVVVVRVVGPPQPQPDCYRVPGSTLVVPAPGVAGNDGGMPSVRLDSAPTRAVRFAFNQDGSFEYTATAGFSGTDRFTYRAQSGPFLSAPVEVCLYVVPENRPEGPEARFTYTTPVAGSAVHFTDTSYDPDGSIVSWTWTIPGQDATGPTATHVFEAPGNYVVRLRVTDDSGRSDIEEQTVIVTAPKPVAAAPPPASETEPAPKLPTTTSPPPPPAFKSGFTAATDGLTATFAALETGATEYRWDFGDGTTATGPAATHLYAAPGTYTVTLRFKAGATEQTATKSVTVEAVDAGSELPDRSIDRGTGDVQGESEGETTEGSALGLSTIALAALGAGGAVAAAGLGALLVMLSRRGRRPPAGDADAPQP